MRSCYVLALAALVGMSACGNTNNGDDGGGGNIDMAVDNRDLTGVVFDLVVVDLVKPPDSMQVFWDLWNKLKQGETDNMQAWTCMQAAATEIKFYVKNPANNMEVTTTVPCPSAKQNGDAIVKLPDSTAGPFSICATLPGKAMSVSFKVMNVMRTQQPNITIFAEGCTETKCMCP